MMTKALLAALIALPVAAADLEPPTPTEPPFDPDFNSCVKPNAITGLAMRWRKPEDGGNRTYLLIKRREGDDWQTYVQTYVNNPPFTLGMGTQRARNSDFAWMLFTVDPQTGEYVSSEWYYFCTRE